MRTRTPILVLQPAKTNGELASASSGPSSEPHTIRMFVRKRIIYFLPYAPLFRCYSHLVVFFRITARLLSETPLPHAHWESRSEGMDGFTLRTPEVELQYGPSPRTSRRVFNPTCDERARSMLSLSLRLQLLLLWEYPNGINVE